MERFIKYLLILLGLTFSQELTSIDLSFNWTPKGLFANLESLEETIVYLLMVDLNCSFGFLLGVREHILFELQVFVLECWKVLESLWTAHEHW